MIHSLHQSLVVRDQRDQINIKKKLGIGSWVWTFFGRGPWITYFVTRDRYRRKLFNIVPAIGIHLRQIPWHIQYNPWHILGTPTQVPDPKSPVQIKFKMYCSRFSFYGLFVCGYICLCANTCIVSWEQTILYSLRVLSICLGMFVILHEFLLLNS